MKILIITFLFMHSLFWPMDAPILPGDRVIIINKLTNELAWIDQGEIQFITRVATGKTEDLTPEGIFTITVKAKNPYYRKNNIPGGDPRNPLGSRWIGFNARGTDGRIYGIHGTNQPESIGGYVSEGCIRMEKDLLERLYDEAIIGMKILIVSTSKSFEQIALENGAK